MIKQTGLDFLYEVKNYYTSLLNYEYNDIILIRLYKAELKQSLYKPIIGSEVPEVSGFQISRQLARECGKVVGLSHQPPLLRRKYSWNSFLLETESTPGI
jgi:hypothetical protein